MHLNEPEMFLLAVLGGTQTVMAVDYNVTLFQVLLPVYVESSDRCNCWRVHDKVQAFCFLSF